MAAEMICATSIVGARRVFEKLTSAAVPSPSRDPSLLTKTSQYALRALHALLESTSEWRDVDSLAKECGLLSPYLSKVLASLARRGFVESRKGPGGGFRVAPGAGERTLGELIRELEGQDALRNCIFGFPNCSDDLPCPLHDGWARVRASYEEMVDGTTIGDLATRENSDE